MKVSRAILSDLPNICILANNAYRGEEAKKGWTFESDFIEGDKRTDENDLCLLFSNEKSVFLIAKNAILIIRIQACKDFGIRFNASSFVKNYFYE